MGAGARGSMRAAARDDIEIITADIAAKTCCYGA